MSTKQTVYTIYCHTHIATGRRYIGLTRQTMMQRWNRHVYNSNSNKVIGHGRSYFPNAIRKYGKDAFSHEVLEIHTDLEQANLAEEWFIRLLRTRDPQFGFNLKRGGKHIPHPIKNPWDRSEYRAVALPISLEHVRKAGEVASQIGAQSRPEVRARMSETMRKVASTPEGRERCRRAANPGKTLSDEHRAKISENDATKRPEVRAKISEKARAKWNDPEYRKKQSESRRKPRGPLSEEHRRKISEALRTRGQTVSSETSGT